MLRLPLCLGILLTAGLSALSAAPVNYVTEPGAKLSADCHFAKFTPDKAGDGNDSQKESRWVSTGEHAEHWLAVDFGTAREVNQIGLKFWSDGSISRDFDIQLKEDDGWKTVREVRGNDKSNGSFSFQTAETTAVRILFKKQIPDKMVRLYELSVSRLEHPVELSFSDGFRDGMNASKACQARLSISTRADLPNFIRNGLAVGSHSSCKNRRRECRLSAKKRKGAPEGAVFCALRNLA